MPSRYIETIDTGVALEPPTGYHLRFALVADLAKQGLMILDVDVSQTTKITILNASRNIITLSEGSPLVEVGLEKAVKVEW